jgi:hypothetical protein
MLKSIMIVAIVAALLLLAVPGYSYDLVKSTKVEPVALTGAEQIPNATYHPSSPGLITQSPGDTVGFTQYDYQSNASTGRRIAIDGSGVIHVAWMNGNPFPSQRHIFYNCLTVSGWLAPGTGNNISYRNIDGYCHIAVTPDDRASIAYHNATTGSESTYVATDVSNCIGFFSYFHPPNRYGGSYYMWPYIAIGRDGNLHVTMTNNASPENVLYTRSNNGGTTWTALQVVDVSNNLSQVIASSPVSDKIVIAYSKQVHDEMTDTTTGDMAYVESLDGITWDFTHPVSVTHYGTDRDSLGVGWDIDAVYDYNDNLHLIYNVRPQHTPYIYYETALFHFSTGTGVITQIGVESDSVWPNAGCSFPNYCWHFNKVSAAVSPTPGSNEISVAYTDYDTSDCSQGGYANGDIYMHSSFDNGATWGPAINVTDSHTPGCFSGDCDADDWPTMAEKADGNSLHILYVNDKDAGAIPQTQGTVTDNPMLYLRVPITGVSDDIKVPSGYALAQNYPNPFNARTMISFEIPRASHVSIEIFDVLGRKVGTLLNEDRPAGPQQVTWNADSQPSGIYTYRLTTEEFALSKKMLLVK